VYDPQDLMPASAVVEVAESDAETDLLRHVHS